MLVDVEPLYFMLTHQYPIHRFFHTFVGATVAAAIVIGLFGLVRNLMPRLTVCAFALGAILRTSCSTA